MPIFPVMTLVRVLVLGGMFVSLGACGDDEDEPRVRGADGGVADAAVDGPGLDGGTGLSNVAVPPDAAAMDASCPSCEAWQACIVGGCRPTYLRSFVHGTSAMAVFAVDRSIYVTGTFSGAWDFNPGPGTDMKQAVGGTDVYVTRLASNGAYAWTVVFGGSGDDQPNALVSTDDLGVAIVGQYTGSVDFDPEQAQTIASAPAGAQDGFLVKLRPSGGLAFARTFATSTASPKTMVPRAVAQSAGDLLIAGSFEGSIETGAGVATATTLDGFVARYMESGRPVWSKTIPGAGRAELTALSVDDTTLWVAGLLTGVSDLTAGGGPAMVDGGTGTGFLTRFDLAQGRYQDVITWQNSHLRFAQVLQDGDDLLLAGETQGQVDLDPRSGGSDVWTTQGSTDGVLLHLSANRGVRWKLFLGGGGQDSFRGAALARSGEVVATGTLGDAGQVGDLALDPAAGGTVVVVVRDGRIAGQFGVGSRTSGPMGVQISPAGRMLLFGAFDAGSGDFRPGPATETLDGSRPKNGFLSLFDI